MSTFFLADRVKELSRTETTGPIVLDGAVTGFSGFDDFFASGDVVFYAITDNVDYEIGSGVYEPNGADRVITRFPFRSSNINSGPYFLNGSSSSGPTAGQSGYFYPLYLTRSAAQSGVGYSDGPYSSVMEHTFSGSPGITFYMPSEHQGHGTQLHGGVSGTDYAAASSPVDFNTGVKEVFVTYPGKSAVYNGYGLDSDVNEPKDSGVAFWRNEQILNYSNQMVWDDTNNRLGIAQVSPQYAIDIGGSLDYSIINVSGIIEGGSGILFSGGQITYTGATASGGKQLEPFLRNQLGNAANGVIALSGNVDQFIGFSQQTPGTVFAGPTVDHCGTPPCSPGNPSFRLLDINDIPLAALTTSGNFVLQKNIGLDGQTANISPDNFTLGMVAIYAGSGSVTYDSGILFDYNNNRLLVGGDASTDTPSYTLDARGTIGSQSGYLNQLIFTDDLIRIGTRAGTNNGNLTENYHLIGIGNDAGYGVSGIADGVLIGHYTGLNSQLMSGVVLLGVNAAAGGSDVDDSIGVGQEALASAIGVASSQILGSGAGSGLLDSNSVTAIGAGVVQGASGLTNVVAVDLSAALNANTLTDVIAVGRDAASESINLTNCYLLGYQSASGASILQELVGLGSSVAREASGIQNAVALGNQSLMYASGVDQSNFIGERAGRSGLNLVNVVGVGTDAAESASGSQNIYIGNNAGIAVSGHDNIEIIGSGGAASFLGTEASGKINIGNTIVGDIYSGKTSVGNPSDANPVSTLTVYPKNASDTPFIIRHLEDGSDQYTAFQSGDGTTFYHVTNSGDVITSGCMNPSGGLLLEPITNSGTRLNSAANRLINDAGTLKFNGSTITTGGAYSWNLTNGAVAADEITDAQNVTISGVSGVEVQYDPASNFLRVSASGLSGVLQDQISDSLFQFYTLASGEDAGNNALKLMEKDSVIALSGVSGIHIDFSNLTDGTNSSGLYTIGYDPSSSYTFNVTNGDVADDIITSTETVTISGVSGVRAEYNATTNTFRIGASGLSGVLQFGIDSNLGFLSNENGPISVSGVSGIAAYASGQVASITLGGATSGLIQTNNNYIMDPLGSGNLARLNANVVEVADFLAFGSVDSILIQNHPTSIRYSGGPSSTIIGGEIADSFADLGGNHDSVTAIGSRVFWKNSFISSDPDYRHTVAIGRYAMGAPSPSIGWSTAVGNFALFGASGTGNVGVGYQAGSQIETGFAQSAYTRKTNNNVALGYQAGAYQHHSVTGVDTSIGHRAGYKSSSGVYNINLGPEAGSHYVVSQYDTVESINIGWRAGADCNSTNNIVNIGTLAGYNQVNSNRTVAVGFKALSSPGLYVDESVAIGFSALEGANAVQYNVSIGYLAGYQASGCYDSVFIGRSAGKQRSGRDSIILSTKQLLGGVYSANWSPHDEDDILDIGEAIQGKMSPVNLHIGADLNNTYRTVSDILLATVNITPDSTTDSALLLNLHSSDGSTTSQAAGLLKTQTHSQFSNINSTLNEVINENGWLRLPEATAKAGSSPNTVLYTSTGEIIPVGQGVVATYDFGTDQGLAVCLLSAGVYQWYSISTTTLM